MSLAASIPTGQSARNRSALCLLRGFELSCDGASVVLPTGAQRLLVFLALHDRALSRAFVAGTLWLDVSESRAHANLRSALWRLRKCSPRLVESFGDQLALSPEVVVDLREAWSAAQRVLSAPDDTFDVVDHWTFACDILPDWYDEWLGVERERFRHLRLHALEALCARHLAAERHALAVDTAILAATAEPLRESAQRALIAAHLAEGNLYEAVQCYHAYRGLLAEQLGLEPSPATQRLVEGLSIA